MVKCADCGFLAMRNLQTRVLEEAEDLLRKHADHVVIGMASVGVPIVRTGFSPICFTRETDLRAEIAEYEGRDQPREAWALYMAVNEERECAGFTPWHQGFSPKEHLEMLNQEKMLKWQADREEADRAHREREANENRKWRFREFVVAVIGVIVVTIVTLGSAVIERDGQPTIIVNVPAMTTPATIP